jgi:hypothetical protein
VTVRRLHHGGPDGDAILHPAPAPKPENSFEPRTNRRPGFGYRNSFGVRGCPGSAPRRRNCRSPGFSPRVTRNVSHPFHLAYLAGYNTIGRLRIVDFESCGRWLGKTRSDTGCFVNR